MHRIQTHDTYIKASKYTKHSQHVDLAPLMLSNGALSSIISEIIVFLYIIEHYFTQYYQIINLYLKHTKLHEVPHRKLEQTPQAIP